MTEFIVAFHLIKIKFHFQKKKKKKKKIENDGNILKINFLKV